MNFKNSLKEKIRRGQAAIGSWIALNDPYAVEVMANTGFEWLLIDTEHCAIGVESLRSILVALKGSPSVPIVRLMNNNPDYFKMALDLGAGGVIVPMVQTKADALRAVDSCFYPPKGNRGCGPVRASVYNKYYEEYMKNANEETLLVVQIETFQTLAHLDDILNVEGLDGIFVGPADLGLSLLHLPDEEKPTLDELISQIFNKAREHNVPYGTVAGTPEQFVKLAQKGATLLTVGGDLGFLLEGARNCQKNTYSLLNT